MPEDPISDRDSPSSSPAGSARRRVAERLDEAECLPLLGAGGIGRLVYNSRYGPMALPVEYKMHDGSVVSEPARTPSPKRISVRVLRTPDTKSPSRSTGWTWRREGWTVLVRGAAHHVDTETERASIINAGVEPWIEGEPEHVIRIGPTRIWGHRIRRA